MFYRVLKRVVDFCLAFCGLLFALPIIVVIAVIIRVSSKGPAFFAQERAGRGCKPFTMYKFRTMRTDADPFGASPKSGADPRITPIGRFLREYSLDELPQLFNMLLGDMAFIGPRPLYMAQAAEWDERQRRRLEIRPGLTGLAQVSGRGGLTIEEKLELDVRYVETEGFMTDVRIVLGTFGAIIGKK
ncbi:MAG: sugar transferase, partial [Phycisphaerae bacterium]|nr:sugar transferase [Phycisphaerae bacterium]